MPQRRIPYGRRGGRVRRYGFRAAAVGGAQLAYQAARRGGSRFANTVNSLRRGTRVARYVNNALKQASKGAPLMKILSGAEAGDYTQKTEVKIQTGRKPRQTLRSLTKEVQQRSEPIIYRYSGVKAFDDYGYYWCGTSQNAGVTAWNMPCYVYDLTAVINVGAAGAVLDAYPLQRAKWLIADGNIQWDIPDNLNQTGTTQTPGKLTIEKRPWNSSLAYPHEKSRLLWTDVKMNLWGSKNKACKWIIQLVKIVDDNIDPFKTPQSALEHSSFWQSKLKHLVYNPIATSGGDVNRRAMKVLKTYTKIIQPTSSTENDVDPHAVTLKWFMKWYRNISYKNAGKILDGNSTSLYDADFVQATQSDANAQYTDTRSKIFLLIRCEAYSREDTPTNGVTPSFDLVVRTCHEAQ